MADYLLIDGSSVLYAACSGKTLRVGEQETHGIYGFLRTLRAAMLRYPMLTPIVLWDGQSWRKKAIEGYKASRDVAEPVTKAEHVQQLLRESFKSQRPILRKALQNLAIKQLWSFNMEADDLAAIMVRRYAPRGSRIILLSGDQDWIQLVQPRVGWMDPIVRKGEKAPRTVTSMNFEEKMGVKTPRAFVECKALMGDSSDEIPGVGGIGEKGAKELLNTYGSVVDFLNMTIEGTLPKLPKKLADFADSDEKQNIWRRNMMLMDLNDPSIPKPHDMRPDVGKWDGPAFANLCRDWLFTSILADLPTWIIPFSRLAHPVEEIAA